MKFEYEVPELKIVKFNVLNSVLVASATTPSTYVEETQEGGGDPVTTWPDSTY